MHLIQINTGTNSMIESRLEYLEQNYAPDNRNALTTDVLITNWYKFFL